MTPLNLVDEKILQFIDGIGPGTPRGGPEKGIPLRRLHICIVFCRKNEDRTCRGGAEATS